MVTPTQHRIYQFIQQFIATNNYSPSLIEIAKGIGVRSKSLISRYVHALQQAGLIDLEPKGYRQIRLKLPAGNIPLMGRIAAGLPIEAIPQQESLNLHELMTSQTRGTLFALEVKGDSMIDDGIFHGDLILCEAREHANENEIAVALVDNQEATLKRVRHQTNGNVILVPANAALKPMVYEAHRVRIQGIYVGLIRVSKRLAA